MRGKIEVRGTDRVSFLHNILTNDIESLKEGQNCEAAILTATGKVLATMRVFRFEDHVLLDTESGLEDKLLPLLDKYLITEDVEIKKIERLIHLAIPTEARHIFLPESEASQVPDLLKQGLVPAGFRAAEILRIEAGQPRYGIDIDETISLPETGMDDYAASESKGCYPGQEVVARTKTYKGLQKKLCRLVWEGDVLPAKGDPILIQDQNAGWITSACYSPGLKKGVGLGYLKKGFFEERQDVVIETGGIKFQARTP